VAHIAISHLPARGGGSFSRWLFFAALVTHAPSIRYSARSRFLSRTPNSAPITSDGLTAGPSEAWHVGQGLPVRRGWILSSEGLKTANPSSEINDHAPVRQSPALLGKRSGCLGSLPCSRQYSSRCHREKRVAQTPRTMAPTSRKAVLATCQATESNGRSCRTNETTVNGTAK
jgi:hypothetical protein